MSRYIKNIDPIQTRKPASDQVVFINDKTGLGSISIAGQVFKILDVGYVCGYPTFTCMILDRFACLFFPPSYCNVCAVCWHIEGIVPVPDWLNCGIQSGAYGLLVFFKSAWMCHCLRRLGYVSINVNLIQFVGTTPGFCGLPVIAPPFLRFNPFPFIPLGGGEPPLLTNANEITNLSLNSSDEKKAFVQGVEQSMKQHNDNPFITRSGFGSDTTGLSDISDVLEDIDNKDEFLKFIDDNNDVFFDDDIIDLNAFDDLNTEKKDFLSAVDAITTIDSNTVTFPESVDSNGFIVDLTSDGCGDPFRPGITHSEAYNPSDFNTIKDLCTENSENGLSAEVQRKKDKKCLILNPKSEHIYSRMPQHSGEQCLNNDDNVTNHTNKPISHILGQSGCQQQNHTLMKDNDEKYTGKKQC